MLKSNFTNMVLVLTSIALFSAAASSSIYIITKEPIEAIKKVKQDNAIREVLPSFDRVEGPEPVVVAGIGRLSVYKAFDSNRNFVGAAVESFSKNGFNGEIKVMVGFDTEGNIINYSVLEQKETPGLGTKVVDWFKPFVQPEKSLVEKLFGFEIKISQRKSSIIGKNPGNDNLTVSKDGGEIDAITASTISSRAFLEAVQHAYEVYKNIK
jgi:electron transport complex protein RnfG